MRTRIRVLARCFVYCGVPSGYTVLATTATGSCSVTGPSPKLRGTGSHWKPKDKQLLFKRACPLVLAVGGAVIPLLSHLRDPGGTQHLSALTSICPSLTGDGVCREILLYWPLALQCGLDSSSETQPGDFIRGRSMRQLMWLGAPHRRHLHLSLPSAVGEILAFLNHSDPKLIPRLSMSPFSDDHSSILTPFPQHSVSLLTYFSMSCVKSSLCQLFSHHVCWGNCDWSGWLLGSLLVEWTQGECPWHCKGSKRLIYSLWPRKP